MYLAYVDESGTSSHNDPTKFYILGAIIVDERNWYEIDQYMEYLKNENFGWDKKINEIHAGQLYNRKGIYSKLTEQQMNTVFENIYSFIANTDLTLISIIIDKTKLASLSKSQDPQFLAWKFLFERIDMYVNRQCYKYEVSEGGLIIMDESHRSQDDKIRRYTRSLRYGGTEFQNIQSIIEDPVFTPSDWRNITQLADCLTYCCLQNELQKPFFMEQFNIISGKFDDGDSGTIHGRGLKKYPL